MSLARAAVMSKSLSVWPSGPAAPLWSCARADRFLNRLERFAGVGAVRAARLRHVGASAAAFAAERGGTQPHELDGVETARLVRRDGDDEARLAVLGRRRDRHDARADALLGLVGQRLEILHVDAGDGAGVELHAGDLANGVDRARAASAHRQFPLGVGEFALELALVVDQALEAFGRLVGRR